MNGELPLAIRFPVQFREIRTPVTPDQLRPLDQRCTRIQFSQSLKDDEHKQVAQLVRQHPSVELRVYGHISKDCSLGFLTHYPNIRNLSIDVYSPSNMEAVEQIAMGLESFSFGETKKVHSLKFLQNSRKLKSLYLERQQKDIEVVSGLKELESVTLRSIKLKDLSLLVQLEKLNSLKIKLGSTADLSLLPKLTRLRYLELWRIRGLSDLNSLAETKSLQYLFLQCLNKVEQLPSFAELNFMRRVHIETMKSLDSLDSVARAPALEELEVVDMKHLAPDDFLPFVNHKKLRNATIAIGSSRKNDAIAKLVRLPKVDRQFTFLDS